MAMLSAMERVGESMTIDKLLTLRLHERRRLAQSGSFSPEWDAAMAAVEDIEELLRARGSEASDAAKSRPPSTDTRAVDNRAPQTPQ
jgi:hypothetical protein